jgi:hypothetical protein
MRARWALIQLFLRWSGGTLPVLIKKTNVGRYFNRKVRINIRLKPRMDSDRIILNELPGSCSESECTPLARFVLTETNNGLTGQWESLQDRARPLPVSLKQVAHRRFNVPRAR